MGQVSPDTFEKPLLLSLETATRAGSLALMRGATSLASLTSVTEESHSINLLQQIESLLEGAAVTLRDIDLFTTAAGPGSFTGLRIGLATIKGFAQTLARPCIGVPTLYALAHAGGISNSTCALLPAGRGEVFAQLLRVSARGHVSPLNEAAHLPPQQLLERLSETRSLRWTGPGALLYADEIKERAGVLGIDFVERDTQAKFEMEKENQWTLVKDQQVMAEHVGILALQQFRGGDFACGPSDLQAIYVRPSDAELNK